MFYRPEAEGVEELSPGKPGLRFLAPSGRPGTSCLATIGLSLRDKGHSTAEASKSFQECRRYF
jgi:hypothetical protein